MTESTTSPVAPPKPPVSTGRRILVIALALVVAIAVYFGVRFVFDAIATAAVSSQAADAEEEVVDEQEVDEAQEVGTFTDEAGGFSVGMDGEPIVAQVDETTTSTTGKLATADYQIFVVNSPEALTGEPAAVRENVLTGFAATSGVTVRASTVDTLGSEEALLAITDLEGNPTLHIAIAIHNELIYVVIVPELDNDDDDAVFESFTFTS